MRELSGVIGGSKGHGRVCGLLILLVGALGLHAQTLTTLHSFDSTDGAFPFAGLVQATDGNFYGTTYNGGASNNGAVYRITTSGALTTIYSFCSQSNCTDGALPRAGLIQATNGSLYGSTVSGGTNDRGTVFKITLGGSLTTVYNFCQESACADGSSPYGTLLQASNGNFYGTTYEGGANSLGSVFELTPAGTLTTLYSFCPESGCLDGASPSAGLVQASNGSFYGTTQGGGANKNSNCNLQGCGTVFKLTGVSVQVLYSFCSKANCSDGQTPDAGLTQGSDGNFYGTTQSGGVKNTYGTVFKITPTGKLTTLHAFCVQNGCPDGENPVGGLIQATDGNFYGTTSSGGTLDGTIYKITPAGKLSTLYNFCSIIGCGDGSSPYAPLLESTNGKLYGTNFLNGANGYGTVFSFAVGLGAFVETQPTSGKVGTSVKILGTNLMGTTGVTFNGTAASFKVVSNSEITTVVPTGATSGIVRVNTPKGELSSDVPFQIP